MVEAKPEVRFFYQKSQHFRVIHADGAMGGLTPRGLLHLAFYSERSALPQVQTHNLLPDGRLSDPISSDGKDGIVREIDFDVMMSKQTALDLQNWLNDRINEFDAIERLIESENKA